MPYKPDELVRCNKAGKFPATCKNCDHHLPHRADDCSPEQGLGTYTQCFYGHSFDGEFDSVPVRCIRLKPKLKAKKKAESKKKTKKMAESKKIAALREDVETLKRTISKLKRRMDEMDDDDDDRGDGWAPGAAF